MTIIRNFRIEKLRCDGLPDTTGTRPAQSNVAKHQLSFEEAANVFSDPDVVVEDASRAEDHETRLKAIGLIEGLLFTVVFTARGRAKWLISARRANVQEERADGYRPPFE